MNSRYISVMASILSAAILFIPSALGQNQNPIADAGADQSATVDASCKATVTLNGSASTDPDGDTLSFTWTGNFLEGGGTATGSATVSVTFQGTGVHTATLTVDDGHGGMASDTVDITLVDSTPPVISSITVNPATLWPPNHKFVHATVSVSVTDNCDPNPVCTITSITSNQAVDAKGSGHTAPDFLITGALTADVRAERSGRDKNGRTYTLTIQCTDVSGNSVTGSAVVLVPHDRRHHHNGQGGNGNGNNNGLGNGHGHGH